MEVIYQVLPRVWGKGKFSDWDSKCFDYLKSLHVSAVWFTGVIRHASGRPFVKGDPGSPYSIEDYHDVNPYLADEPEKRMQEFRNLVRRTHRAGLKVIIDYIPNHVSPECKDVPVCSWYDYDWSDTRKVDYKHPDTWKRMREIVSFWASLGVDGFRCDMVEMVPPEFLEWLIAELKKEYPALIFIGEAYEKGNYRRYIQELGFDYLYDKSGLYDNLRSIICRGSTVRGITRNWQFLQDLQPHMLNFLENHDEQRFASPYFAGDALKAGPALAVGALFNKASYMLYMGQEIGTDASEGAEGRTSIFNWTHPEPLKRLYRHIHGSNALTEYESGVLQAYRAVFECLSPSNIFGGPIFLEGENYDLCWCNSVVMGFDPEKHFAFMRHYLAPGAQKASAVVVLCNFSDRHANMTLNIPEDLRAREELAWLPAKLSMSVSPWGYSILSL
ncbi:MAG: hypothetical protein K6F21_00610 [Bacteroidales bacterium]|nr:hypothetical protein [Bacteroidales bacterium]